MEEWLQIHVRLVVSSWQFLATLITKICVSFEMDMTDAPCGSTSSLFSKFSIQLCVGL